MCGPIAIALPVGAHARPTFVLGRFLYNAGRILTYAFLGMLCGWIGKTIMMAGYQQTLSIALGILILFAVLLPTRLMALLTGQKLHARIIGQLQSIWTRLFARTSPTAMFGIGLLNGFLPCGLVYVALAGAIGTGHPQTGALYMALFGAGTFPVMFVMSLVGRLVGSGVRRGLRRLVPVGAVALGVIFILRGMSLGIPYVSPKIQQNQAGEVTAECCHQTEPDAATEMSGVMVEGATATATEAAVIDSMPVITDENGVPLHPCCAAKATESDSTR